MIETERFDHWKVRGFNELTQDQCWTYFGKEEPDFASLPHVIFHADPRVFSFLRDLFECSLALYPSNPVFSESGERCPDEWGNIPYWDIWRKWKNSFNQTWLIECCCFPGNQDHINDRNFIVVRSDFKADSKEWEKLIQNEKSIKGDVEFENIIQRLELTDWHLTPIYNEDKYLLVAKEKYRNKIDLFKTWFLRCGYDIPYAWLSDPKDQTSLHFINGLERMSLNGELEQSLLTKKYLDQRKREGKYPLTEYEKNIDKYQKEVLTPLQEKTSRVCARITLTRKKTKPLDSKVGGIPYMPKGFLWPTVWEGENKGASLRFLAQLNFSEIPPIDLFPERGILQFYLYDDDMLGMDFDDPVSQNQFRVIWLASLDLPHDSDLYPKDLGEAGVCFPVDGEYRMTFQQTFDSMDLEDWRYNDLEKELFLKAFPNEKDRYCPDARSNDKWYDDCMYLNRTGWRDNHHLIGGYPVFEQGDPRRFSERNRDKDIQLFQLATEKRSSKKWKTLICDCGVCQFLISEKDLIERNFKNVFYTAAGG